ncbi:MAG: hypothetical protein RIF41_34255, partial [Polyangiaceae bacterium]
GSAWGARGQRCPSAALASTDRRGAPSVPLSRGATSGTSRRLVVVAVVLVAVIAVALLLARTT